jgi:hypothetical protein
MKLIKRATLEEVKELYSEIILKKDNFDLDIIYDLIIIGKNYIERFGKVCGWGNMDIVFKDLPLSKLSLIYNDLNKIKKKYNI